MSVNKIPSLDGFRAFSVLLVLLSHAGFGNVLPGGFGVTVFFFLSGYLITTLLILEFDKTNQIKFTNFFIRRFFRLFPPLAITLSLAYLLVYMDILGGGISFNGFLSQFFYLANYHMIFQWPGDIPDGTGILWSLAVEEHFYFIFPFIFYFSIKNTNRVYTAWLLVCICLFVLAWRIFITQYFQVSHERTYYGTDTRIDSILFGCILALCYNPVFNNRGDSELNFKSYLILTLCCVVILSSFLFRNEFFRETFRYTLQGIALMPIFYFAILFPQHWAFKMLNQKHLVSIGIYSYFIYLIHFILIKSFENLHIFESKLLLIILVTFLSIFYAWLIDKYFDHYFKRLRKKFR